MTSATREGHCVAQNTPAWATWLRSDMQPRLRRVGPPRLQAVDHRGAPPSSPSACSRCPSSSPTRPWHARGPQKLVQLGQPGHDRRGAALWWRQLLYIGSLHSVVQERHKFGPIGWNVPCKFPVRSLRVCAVPPEPHGRDGREKLRRQPGYRHLHGSSIQYGGRITTGSTAPHGHVHDQVLQQEQP